MRLSCALVVLLAASTASAELPRTQACLGVGADVHVCESGRGRGWYFDQRTMDMHLLVRTIDWLELDPDSTTLKIRSDAGDTLQFEDALDFDSTLNVDGAVTLGSTLGVTGAASLDGNATVTGTLNVLNDGATAGWTVGAGGNTACTTTCGGTGACLFGFDSDTTALVACDSAAADTCVCGGPSS